MTGRADDEMTHRQVHHATPELLFTCMTTPEHLTCFWGPTGTTTPLDGIVVDLRPGGAFETLMVGDDGSTYRMRATYEVVDPPTHLSWRDVDAGTLTTITFTDRGDGTTEVVTHQRHLPPPHRTPEAREGWATALTRFATYVATLTAE
jgi:uncharacterized protein YndB with AHSA1/START domain